MSAPEDVRAALAASVAENREQVLTEESRQLLADIVREQMRLAVAEGMAAAMTDEAAERFWKTGLEVLQRQAQERAGQFLLDGLMAALRKALWVGGLLLVAYSLGGWSLLKAIWAALTPKG